MAIYTRFGIKCEIVKAVSDTDVEIRYLDDGFHRTVSIMDLKADGGIHEIDEAIAKTTRM